MSSCKLCHQPKKLIKAHIIPESFYQRAGTEPARIVGIGKDFYPHRTPIGVYDEGILCSDCDNKLGFLDQEAAEHLLRGKPQLHYHGNLLTYPDATASLISKFAVSVLWRATVSSHYFFNRVSIGPYAGELREALHEETDCMDVKVIVCEFDRPHPPFLMPLGDRIDGLRVWRVYASRFIFVIKTDRRRFAPPLSELELRDGRPVQSLVLEWDASAERKGMKELVYATKQNRDLLKYWREHGHAS